MKKLLLIILISYFFCAGSIAQNAITGIVVEAKSNKPVASATVFVSNSSSGTSTSPEGVFTLKKLPEGKFTLVVSCIGYETLIKDFQTGASTRNITVKLTRKATDLNEVVITPAEKNGWINWGDLFVEHFIGNSSFARSCRVKNPKVLKFRMQEKDSSLTVTAGEPVVIENKALGYIIRYDLKEFKYYFSDNTVYYSGYALFEDISLNEGKPIKYLEARKKVYAISLMHFIRSLYNGTTQPEGFIIMRKMKNKAIEMKKNNALAEQEYSGQENYDTIYEISNTNTQIKIVANEFADKHNTDFDSDKSSMNSIMSYKNGNVLLNFTDTLQVIYSKSIPPFEYAKYAGDSYSANIIVSELSLIGHGPVTILPNGSFVPANLAMNGFWGWWEKISIMLPYDYQPLE